MKRRTVVLMVAAPLGVFLVVSLAVGATIAIKTPPSQGARLDAGEVVGIETGGSYAWVIPTANGVVLVDSGFDPAARALKAEIDGRTVHAVLVTHGHADHVAGLARFPDAIVYVGPGEGPLVRGEVSPGSLVPRMVGAMMGGEPYAPSKLSEFSDGQTLRIDGVAIQAFHTPGHTRGSAAYLFGDVLFTGDSLVGHGDHVDVLPFAESSKQNMESIERLLKIEFSRIAGGHGGVHASVRSQVEAFVVAN